MQAEVPDSLDGERVDRAVAILLGRSRSAVARLIEAGAIRVDGQPVTTASSRLVGGQLLDVELDDSHAATDEAALAADPGVELRVVHVDDDVIVVDKAAGVVVHPGSGVSTGTLVGGLLAAFPDLADVGDPDRPGIVHRLDAGTTGLLVVARNEESRQHLVAQLQARSVVRRYRSLVWGHPEADRMVIDAPIGRSRRQRTRMAVSEGGREARTRVEVVNRYHRPVEVTEIVCHLETGRTHQIRVHLSSVGHAVVGDVAYRGERQSLPLDRPFLHAEHLEFVHPSTGERVGFDAPLPADLVAVLDQLS